jgi:hypothetical protein
MLTLPMIATTVTAGCGITFRHIMFEVFQGAGTGHALPMAPTVRPGVAAGASALDQLAPPASSEPLRAGKGRRDLSVRVARTVSIPISSPMTLKDHGVVINGWEDARR